jgi:hypothetical protein
MRGVAAPPNEAHARVHLAHEVGEVGAQPGEGMARSTLTRLASLGDLSHSVGEVYGWRAVGVMAVPHLSCGFDNALLPRGSRA